MIPFSAPRTTRELHLTCLETDVADKLTAASKLYSDVNIGSYPSWINNYLRVRITMDSHDEQQLNDCNNMLINEIGHENILNADLNLRPWLLKGEDIDKLSQEDSDLGRKVKNSLQIINESIDKYGKDALCIAFNGGKDCTAILHLYHASLALRKTTGLNSIYIASENDLFDEMEEFLETTHQRYQMNVIRQNGGIKEALQNLKDTETSIKAILMGTRIDDPHGKYVKEFSLTDVDKGWPEFMRVNPILHWTYEDVWLFIRRLHLPYCVLYDRGYTSLGDRNSTVPNPELKVVDENGKIAYRPAYTLKKNSSERRGRQ